MENKDKVRKNSEGRVRKLGTKDYSLILSNLMAHKRKLARENHPQRAGLLMRKIALKMKELGFEEESKKVKVIHGRRKKGKFQNLDSEKSEKVGELALKVWQEAHAKQEKAKKKAKEEKGRALRK